MFEEPTLAERTAKVRNLFQTSKTFFFFFKTPHRNAHPSIAECRKGRNSNPNTQEITQLFLEKKHNSL